MVFCKTTDRHAVKTSLDIARIADFASRQFGEIQNVKQMTEGEESQAFSFRARNASYVMRVNPEVEGFLKDDYAYRQFQSLNLPIPKVVKVGRIDAEHAFCISEMLQGITLQDADEMAVVALLPALTNLWEEVGKVNIANSKGYGDFASNGNAGFSSWRDYLLSILDESKYQWAKLQGVDDGLIKEISSEFAKLVENCPEERKLVHGDFGSNNVLVDTEKSKITAILDWENALYGDPLFDVAIAYFWRTWLMCMEKSAAYWESRLSSTENYQQRMRCYQLRIGLHEIYDNALDGDTEMLAWLQNRCRQILDESM